MKCKKHRRYRAIRRPRVTCEACDLQMARGSVDGGYNLAVGEPVILQRALGPQIYKLSGPFPYPTMNGEECLASRLQAMYPGEEVVITVGAKQALSAAFYAIGIADKKTHVYHEPPYWPSYRTLTKLADLRFIDDANFINPHTIYCVTSPNNPDGRIEKLRGTVDIWDAAYASPVYGWDGTSVDARIRVYSAAKLYGVSGARVGWLVTKDKELAKLARIYVELTTSGVSIPAQQVVAETMAWIERDWMAKLNLEQARAELLENGLIFNQILRPYCQEVRGVPATGTGMFAYFKVKNELIDGMPGFVEAAEEAKVALVWGTACGESYSGWFRMSMGNAPEYTERALRALEEKLR